MCIGSPSFSVWSLRAQRSPNHQSEPLCFLFLTTVPQTSIGYISTSWSWESNLGFLKLPRCSSTALPNSTFDVHPQKSASLSQKFHPKKNNLQNLGIRKVIHQSSFLVNPPPPFPLSPPVFWTTKNLLLKKIYKNTPLQRCFFLPRRSETTSLFLGGRFSDYAKKRKALKLAREKAASRSCQGWKSQVEVTMMALVGGGGVFRLLVFFWLGTMGSRDIQ